MDQFALLIAATLNAGTVIAIAALGLLINEKAGVVNLGAEGMMLIAAMTGFAVTFLSGSPWFGFAAGALAGACCALLLCILVIGLNANQYASGLALSLFGTGFAAFMGQSYVGKSLVSGAAAAKSTSVGTESADSVAAVAEAGFGSTIPFFGKAFFGHHPLVYFAIVLAIAIAWFLYRTRAGLVLRAVGESPESAHALGYPVRTIRVAAMAFGGACCGLAGAYLSVVYTPLWVEGMTAGRGWIALALTAFATWRPARALLGAYLFGGITMIQFYLQAQGVQVPAQLLSMLPYLATIVVLVLISSNPNWIRTNMPASIGKPFYPG